MQLLEHKWKTPRGQNKRERRRYLIVLIKCFKALHISPPQAALTDSQHRSGLSGMLATPAPFFRWFGRSELSRDAVAGTDTIRVSFQLRDSSPGSHEGRSRCEIKLWLEWFEIQAQACWALCSLKSGYVDGLIAGVTLTPRCLRHYTSKLTFLLSTWTLKQEQLRDTICFLTHSSCWAAHRPAETFKKLL